MLDTFNLSCARGDRTLFRGLAFELQRGEVLHVIGPNGSGKTTLLRTVCGLTRPLDGQIRWNTADIRTLGDDYRAQLAYVGHLNGIQSELTPPENLRAVGATDVGRIESALARLALDPYGDFPAKILSQGQKRRLALARLMVLDRPLWVLDEPLAALDARSVEIVIRILSEHLDLGGMAILTSHQEIEMDIRKVRVLSLEHR